MKTRAILQTSPFKTRDGEWRAEVRVGNRLTGFSATVHFGGERADLKPGDTITVEKHGSEWRAV